MTVNVGLIWVGPARNGDGIAEGAETLAREARCALTAHARRASATKPCLRLIALVDTALPGDSLDCVLSVLERLAATFDDVQLVLPSAAQDALRDEGTRLHALMCAASAAVSLEGSAGSFFARETGARIVLENTQVLLLAGEPRDMAAVEWTDNLRRAASDAGVCVLRLQDEGKDAVQDAESRAALKAHITDMARSEAVSAFTSPPRVPTDAIEAVRREWQRDWEACGEAGRELAAPCDPPFLDEYAASDYRACVAAKRYRRLGWFRQCCIALAIVFVAVGFYIKPFSWQAFFFQFGFVAFALLAMALNSRLRWHGESMDFRLLAELLRISRMLRPSGRRLNLRQLEHLEIERQPGSVLHRFNAIQRDAGLCPMCWTPESRAACTAFVQNLLSGQIAYQERTALRHRIWHQRFTWLGLVFLFLSIAVILGRAWGALALQPQGVDSAAVWYVPVKFLAIVFPGIAGLCFGLRAFGAHDALAERAVLMAAHLRGARGRLHEPGLDTAAFCQRMHDTAVLMASEVLDWRGIVKGKSIGFPV